MGANEEQIERRKGKLLGGKSRGGSKRNCLCFPRALCVGTKKREMKRPRRGSKSKVGRERRRR